MLKKLIVTVALVGVTAASYGQGQVNFDTLTLGQDAKVFIPRTRTTTPTVPSTTPATGAAYFAQLWAASGAGAAESALARVGSPVNFRGGGNAGYVQTSGLTSKGVEVNPVVDVPAAGPGGATTVQLRAWDAVSDTYEVATVSGQWGKSGLITLNATGNPNGQPPTTPVDLTGLRGFELNDIPEPSTVALGVLGAAALLFARRRK